jgi:DNA mismatch repair protein MSH6
MGGKSTLLRAVCLAVVMAQCGCYVPAASCCMSPVDAIYTRIGEAAVLIHSSPVFERVRALVCLAILVAQAQQAH